MNNPWRHLKEENLDQEKVKKEYIAQDDKNKIAEYQSKLSGSFRLQLGGIPGPYTGDPENAVVYLLALNPGHAEDEERVYEKNNEYLIRNLTHENKEWPFVSFDPVFRDTPGGKWWANKLKELIEKTGMETVARFVFNAEYFPYHSKEYKPLPIILPSQDYTFSLVKKAVQDEKIIVIMRSKKLWYKAVPELQDYQNLIILHSPQNTVLSVNNMGQENFDTIVAALQKAAKETD